MVSLTRLLIAVSCWTLPAVLGAAACDSRGPASPSSPASTAASQAGPPSPSPPSAELFTFRGVVTDEQGAPVVGAEVTMRSAGGASHASTYTDAAGGYGIQLSAVPWTNSAGRYAARAEILADSFDWLYRNVRAVGSQLVENFQLHRVTRITGGDSATISVSPDNGDCLGWLYGPCGRARVVAPTSGELTVEAVLTGDSESREAPQIEACCVKGNEVYGNPLTMSVAGGYEVWIEIGQLKPGVTAPQRVTLASSMRTTY